MVKPGTVNVGSLFTRVGISIERSLELCSFYMHTKYDQIVLVLLFFIILLIIFLLFFLLPLFYF